MRVLVDITHPCDISFFRAPIARWRADGHDVRLVYLDRGKVPALVSHEYPDLRAQRIGRHLATPLGLYLRTGLWRELELLSHLRRQPVDAVVGFPGFQTALVAKALGIKSLGAYDDAEHRPNLLLSKALCDVLVLPECLGISGRNVVRCRALKEWAYLSPRHFCPTPKVLSEYGLEAKGYVFLREIEPRSLNYRTKRRGPSLIEAAYRAGLARERVILSLEDKQRRHLFPEWTILEEPVSDIRSLMYYSSVVASSGDSMAREGAQLGVPSVYLGTRQMKANDALYGLGLMQQITTAGGLLARLPELRASGLATDRQVQIRSRLSSLWEDPADVLTHALYGLMDR